MKLVNLTQGTQEWHAHRAQHFNASDAPAMMGESPYESRQDLIRRLATGISKEVDAFTQGIFDSGHRFEALARPIAEGLVGDDLYPVVGADGKHSASFDGLTLDYSEGFEHKRLNARLKEAFAREIKEAATERDASKAIPLMYRIQMEHQCMVGGCNRILFMASDWDGDGALIEEHHVWYYPDVDLRAAIIAGWDQLEADVAAYVPPKQEDPAAIGRSPVMLPAIRVEVSGAVTASNLAEFRETALSAIRSVNRSLNTDQDFADADKSIKWCSDVEGRISAAKDYALSQTSDIDVLFRTMDEISAEAREVRLSLEKLVKARKESVKAEIVDEARAALADHVRGLSVGLDPAVIAVPAADFGGAIKGKRSFSAMRDAVADVLAKAKIDATSKALAIRVNLDAYKAKSSGLDFLFPNLSTLLHKSSEDFNASIDLTITQHKAREAAKAEVEVDVEVKPVPPVVQRHAGQSVVRPTSSARMLGRQEAAEAIGFDVGDEFIALHVKPGGGIPELCDAIARHVLDEVKPVYMRAA